MEILQDNDGVLHTFESKTDGNYIDGIKITLT